MPNRNFFKINTLNEVFYVEIYFIDLKTDKICVQIELQPRKKNKNIILIKRSNKTKSNEHIRTAPFRKDLTLWSLLD